MRTEAEKARDVRWQKANVTRVQIKLYKNTDADLLEWLEKQENKQGLIKRLLREEMEKGK